MQGAEVGLHSLFLFFSLQSSAAVAQSTSLQCLDVIKVRVLKICSFFIKQSHPLLCTDMILGKAPSWDLPSRHC